VLFIRLNQKTKIWILLVILWVNNGPSFLAIKVAIDTIPPMLSAGIRFSVSGAILFAVYYFLGDSRYDFNKNSQHRILKRIHHPREVISK